MTDETPTDVSRQEGTTVTRQSPMLGPDGKPVRTITETVGRAETPRVAAVTPPTAPAAVTPPATPTGTTPPAAPTATAGGTNAPAQPAPGAAATRTATVAPTPAPAAAPTVPTAPVEAPEDAVLRRQREQLEIDNRQADIADRNSARAAQDAQTKHLEAQTAQLRDGTKEPRTLRGKILRGIGYTAGAGALALAGSLAIPDGESDRTTSETGLSPRDEANPENSGLVGNIRENLDERVQTGTLNAQRTNEDRQQQIDALEGRVGGSNINSSQIVALGNEFSDSAGSTALKAVGYLNQNSGVLDITPISEEQAGVISSVFEEAGQIAEDFGSPVTDIDTRFDRFSEEARRGLIAVQEELGLSDKQMAQIDRLMLNELAPAEGQPASFVNRAKADLGLSQ